MESRAKQNDVDNIVPGVSTTPGGDRALGEERFLLQHVGPWPGEYPGWNPAIFCVVRLPSACQQLSEPFASGIDWPESE